jgi:hypothetical protein
MISPTIGASFEPAHLVIVARRNEHFAPEDDFYQENPIGVFRGLFFAMIFNVMLALTGFAGWQLWHLLR